MKRPGLSDFGPLVDDYIKGRKGFPERVYRLLFDRIGKPITRKKIIDIGCGTGIATRELAKHGCLAWGVDNDPLMIKTAIDSSDKAIQYTVASCRSLRHKENCFDGATAFNSFHWFSDDVRSVKEIKSVLKPGGYFMAVTKLINPGFVSVCREMMVCAIGSDPAEHLRYKPEEALAQAGFTDLSLKGVSVVEEHTIDSAVSLMKSNSLWNLVPQKRRASLEGVMRQYCTSIASKDGDLQDNVTVAVVLAKKPLH